MQSKLLFHPELNNNQGLIHNISPTKAGWTYIGFDVYMLQQGQTISIDSNTDELCIVISTGTASVKTNHAKFDHIGVRKNIFERIPTYSVYVPHHDKAIVFAETACEIVVCKAPGFSDLPARVINPEQVGTEHRGKGHNKRYVQNILPDSEPADSLLVVEVYTDEGNTSSYPCHKHDQDNYPTETLLEELYYHQFELPQGFAMQRVYTQDLILDECMAVQNKDVVVVPKGFHPVATVAGYNNYYLNVMAGPRREWKFTFNPNNVWVNSDQYK